MHHNQRALEPGHAAHPAAVMGESHSGTQLRDAPSISQNVESLRAVREIDFSRSIMPATRTAAPRRSVVINYAVPCISTCLKTFPLMTVSNNNGLWRPPGGQALGGDAARRDGRDRRRAKSRARARGRDHPVLAPRPVALG